MTGIARWTTPSITGAEVTKGALGATRAFGGIPRSQGENLGDRAAHRRWETAQDGKWPWPLDHYCDALPQGDILSHRVHLADKATTPIESKIPLLLPSPTSYARLLGLDSSAVGEGHSGPFALVPTQPHH
jgi:hypothetical protein